VGVTVRKINVYVFGSFFAVLLLVSASFGSNTASVNVASTGAIQSVFDPTFQIRVSSSNYQILNGTTEAVLYQSTSSSNAVNYLLGSSGMAADGSSVYVNTGAYSVDHTWQIRKKNVLMAFASGAVLTSVSHINDMSPYTGTMGGGEPVIWLYGNNIVISGATIDGNGLNQAPQPANQKMPLDFISYSDGIEVSGSNCLVEYSTVYNCRSMGISVAYGVTPDKLGVMNCVVYDIGTNGIMASGTGAASTNCYFINNEVYHCSDVGIDSMGYDTIITGNNVHDCGLSFGSPLGGWVDSGWGIGIEMRGGSGGGKYLLIAGNTVANTYQGICLVGVGSFPYILTIGNTLSNAGYRAIWIQAGTNNVIAFNRATGSTYGVYLAAGTGNTVYDNTGTFYNGGTGGSTSSPTITAVKVTSSSTGVDVVTANGSAGYAGSLSTSPYIFYVTVGNSVALVANNVSGHTFLNWSDGGAQSHTISVSSSYKTYTATYS
jgi:parallel beta-helix repeat protein